MPGRPGWNPGRLARRPATPHVCDVLCDGYWRMVDLLEGRRFVALTGAGCSTESGIPDYRGPDSPRRSRPPLRYAEFVGSATTRARYWSRSVVGWPRIATARPNPGHEALTRLEAGGRLAGIITQNVDGLHRAAGSRRTVELHGDLDRVVCLECGIRTSRADLQRRLLRLNPAWRARTVGPASGGDPIGAVVPERNGASAVAAPDGDAELPAEAAASFRVPACGACGGVLKPDVVFFGENVPPPRVERAWTLFREAEVLLVVGSSLSVYSGYRFVLQADREGVPVAVVNLGPTRGDAEAAVRLRGRSGEVLPLLAEDLLRDVRRAS